MPTSMKARTVLWYVLTFGSLAHFAIRVNLNIAIVAMVGPRGQKSEKTIESECITHLIQLNSTINSNSSMNTTSEYQGQVFDWDEFDQGLLLGSYFWLTWASPVPAAIISRRFGGKTVLGVSQLLGTLLAFVMPVAAYWSLKLLIFLRFLQGAFFGCTPPATHHMFGKWVPPNERGSFNSSYLGTSLGVALMYPLGGLLIDWYGWESVFYASGAIGLIWFTFYWFLVYESPEDHPRISKEEREYIVQSLGDSSNAEKLPTPWKPLLLSLPLWANVIAHFGGQWGHYVLTTQVPTFLKIVLRFDVKVAGILSALPQIARCIFGTIYSKYIADYLLNTNKISRKNVRILSTCISAIVPGLLLILLGFTGCDRTLVVVLITSALGANGAVFAGPLAGIIDLSPNFAGVSMGLMLSICTMAGFISPTVVGALTLNNQTIAQWKYVWLLSAAIMIGCTVIYMFFASAEIQPWNAPVKRSGPELSSLLSDEGPKISPLPDKNLLDSDTKT